LQPSKCGALAVGLKDDRPDRDPGHAEARERQNPSDHLLRTRGPAESICRLSLDEAHHRRGHELATVVSDLDRRCVVDVIDGCARRSIERYLRSLTKDQRQAVEVVSIDPSEAYRQAIRDVLPDAQIVCDHFHLVRGANTALDSVRRERQRQAGRRPRGTRRSGRLDTWNPALYRARHRLLKTHERLNGRERRRLGELFEREPVLAEAWGLKEAFRAVYDADNHIEAARRLDAFLTAVDHASLPAFRRVRQRRPVLARRAAGLLRRAHHQRLRRRHHQQGQGHQAPRLRDPDVHRLPRPCAPSLRLTGSREGRPRSIDENPIYTRP
jgi:transposase